jgi:hypothetical protein
MAVSVNQPTAYLLPVTGSGSAWGSGSALAAIISFFFMSSGFISLSDSPILGSSPAEDSFLFFLFFKEVARGGERTRVLSISFIFSFSPLYC